MEYGAMVLVAWVIGVAMVARWHDYPKGRCDLFLALAVFLLAPPAFARELYPGQYAQYSDKDRAWFKGVHSPNGIPCCDIADGHRTTWRAGKEGYEVPIEGVWTPVPSGVVIYNAGNPLDEAVVWYVKQGDNSYFIRCFVPGDGA